ncbi:hypothetical protein N7537_010047 [Penicillium hordei]|uniref:Uncharacterized protein n=1 Tax=Penicillium hordei TaxID=40994 RepID=A0AAD6GWA5_9EURO|nr:uncharacterized protein N7537_010047 [Penicillium hordei]KAJ5593143.1 hypothetical protein N7537_010047 [Penicillium hordei]
MAVHQKDFDGFLRDFIDIFHLHQQVREITNRPWGSLLESPLKPLLELEASALVQEESPVECSKLLALLNSASIDSSARNIYLEAIKSLQMAINGSRRHSSGQSTIGPIISWLVVVPSDYIYLLGERRPEALIILAHFGALLHLYREIWMLGDSGIYLDSNWDIWLQWLKTIAQCENNEKTWVCTLMFRYATLFAATKHVG